MSETTVDKLDALSTLAAGDLIMVLDDLGAGSYQCKKVTFENLSKGTTSSTFQVDSDNTGPKLKNSSGEMQVRNEADDAYANLRAAVLALSGGQISFPATQNPSADANTLDDYEEGTWTPALSFGGGVTGITYGEQTGNYTKIGNIVILRATITLTSKGSDTGNALITGLPFTVAAYAAVAIGRLVNIAFADFPNARVTASATTINLYETTNAGAATTLTDADFSNDSSIAIMAAYKI